MHEHSSLMCLCYFCDSHRTVSSSAMSFVQYFWVVSLIMAFMPFNSLGHILTAFQTTPPLAKHRYNPQFLQDVDGGKPLLSVLIKISVLSDFVVSNLPNRRRRGNMGSKQRHQRMGIQRLIWGRHHALSHFRIVSKCYSQWDVTLAQSYSAILHWRFVLWVNFCNLEKFGTID